jgi:hypothetical protein
MRAHAVQPQRTRPQAPDPARLSAARRALGKGEVESSILSNSTIKNRRKPPFPNHQAGHEGSPTSGTIREHPRRMCAPAVQGVPGVFTVTTQTTSRRL